MSILIKGMEMPTEDEEIIVRIDSSGTVMTEYALPISWAKAIPFPPHGRLIDADELANSIIGAIYHSDLRDAPTIIPAEEGER